MFSFVKMTAYFLVLNHLFDEYFTVIADDTGLTTLFTKISDYDVLVSSVNEYDNHLTIIAIKQSGPKSNASKYPHVTTNDLHTTIIKMDVKSLHDLITFQPSF